VATTLDESARRAGAHRWAESRLFEILGGWVPSTPVVDAKLLFDRHSQHHAWRAAQWWDRLPVLADVDRASLCAAPPGPIEAALEQMAGAETTVARLAGAYRVALPRLWVAYQAHRAAIDEWSDGASARTLDIALADVAADWHDGERLLQSLLAGPDAVREAALAVADLEAALAGA
jgi:hypothetical protein